jgi:hypothetical protein
LNQVVDIQKVKAVEYQLFSSMHETLMTAIERGELDTNYDKTALAYGREHRALTKCTLPHPEEFYFEVFN